MLLEELREEIDDLLPSILEPQRIPVGKCKVLKWTSNGKVIKEIYICRPSEDKVVMIIKKDGKVETRTLRGEEVPIEKVLKELEEAVRR